MFIESWFFAELLGVEGEGRRKKTAAKNFFKKVLVESKKQLYICSRFEKQVVLKKRSCRRGMK
ncbi:MAG: hypothetical protein ABGW97_09110, partial [Christiangramia sp.]|uniref:hypothetical protein n=1 Tax=Christiangramia sp. TaxID=1931228 RepID=UPI003242084F